MGLGKKLFSEIVLGITLYILISLPCVQAAQLNFSDAGTTVPKSETVVAAGNLNDTKERAQTLNHVTEYAYGSQATGNAWRKVEFKTGGTVVVTLDYDAGSEYGVALYNSCAATNFCKPYQFGNYRTCVADVSPGTYYLEVTKVSGNGEYRLDVDIIEGKQISKTNATDCTSSTTENSCKGSVPLYRFWNTKTGTHFYTTSETEKTKIITTYKEWIYEGITGYIYITQQTNTDTLYRFWNSKTGAHFYTTSEKEKNKLITAYKVE